MIYDVPAGWLLYLRKSVGRAGISRQRVITAGHLAKGGGTVSAEFVDADRTAFRHDRDDIDAPLPPRPGFDALLAEMARRPGIGVAAWHIDRLGRDPEAAEILIRACRRGNHLVRTASGGDYDVTTANGRARLRADISAATYEVDHAVERMVAAKAEAAALGQWLGGPRPFGWRPAGGALELDPRESELVARACSAVLAGVSLSAIAREWHAAGVTGSRGGRQAPEAVRKVLMRPRNAGLMEHRGQLAPGAQWPAIVDEPTWRAVRAVLSDPSRRVSPGPAPRWLMTGIALCGACGATVLIGCRGGSRAPSYRCSKSQRKLPRRPGAHVCRDAAQVDAYVTYLAVGRLKQDDAAALLRADHSEKRAALMAERAKIEARRAEQWRLYQDGVITDWEVRQGRDQLARQDDEVRRQLDGLQSADALAPFLADPERAWAAADLSVRQAVVSALMHVTILPAPPPGALRPVGVPSFDPRLVDVRWARRLPSDG